MSEKQPKINFVYFSAVEGHYARRFGSSQYIGAKLVESGEPVAKSLAGESAEGSFIIEWDEKEVVRIPEIEFNLYGKEYRRLLKEKGLKKRTQKDYDAYIKSVTQSEPTKEK